MLRPNGKIVLIEHVRSPGAYQLREPVDHLLAAGFDVEFSKRLSGPRLGADQFAARRANQKVWLGAMMSGFLASR